MMQMDCDMIVPLQHLANICQFIRSDTFPTIQFSEYDYRAMKAWSFKVLNDHHQLCDAIIAINEKDLEISADCDNLRYHRTKSECSALLLYQTRSDRDAFMFTQVKDKYDALMAIRTNHIAELHQMIFDYQIMARLIAADCKYLIIGTRYVF